jgi:glycosyltransferase involved in cell wall biosynthesis
MTRLARQPHFHINSVDGVVGIHMKTIFLFDHVKFFGGAESHLFELAKGFAELKGCNVYLVSPQGSILGNKIREQSIGVITIEFPPFNSRNPFETLLNLFSFKKSLKSELQKAKIANDAFLISNTTRSFVYTAFLHLFFLRFSQIWILHDYMIPKKFLSIFKFIPKYFVAVSQHVKVFYNLPRTVVIPNAFSIDGDNFDMARKDNGVKFKVGFFGRIVKWKGLHILIDAINRVKQKNHNVMLLIYGSPSDIEIEYYKSVVEQVQRLGLINFVKFRGFVEDVISAMRECDVIVSSSISKYGGPESFGRSLIEAMIAGVPVIATNCGGIADNITDGYNGILVKENNAEELAEAIIILLNNSNLRKEITGNAKNDLSRYSKENVTNEYYNLLNSLR